MMATLIDTSELRVNEFTHARVIKQSHAADSPLAGFFGELLLATG